MSRPGSNRRRREDPDHIAQETRLHYRVLFEYHPHPMWVVDPRTLKILAANAAAVRHYGYSQKEFLAMSLHNIHPPEHVPTLLGYAEEQRQKSAAAGAETVRPWVHRKKDGTLIEVEVSRRRILFRGRPAVLAMADDVSERRKAQGQIQRNLERLQIIHEISAAITTTLDLDTVLEFFLRKANRLLPESVITLKLWNEEKKLLEPVLCRNLDEKEWKTALGRRNGGLTQIPFETNEPLVVPHIENDPRAGRPEFARKHGLVSYLGVPLSAQGEIIGVFSTYTKEEHRFSPEEIDFFSTLASQVALAVQNAKIFDQAQQTLKRLRALHEINVALAPLLDVRSVLDTLLEKVTKLLPYAAVTIRLLNNQTGELEASACCNIDEAAWKSEEINPPHGFRRALFDRKAPIHIRNVQTDPIIWQHELFRSHGLVSCLAVPLMSKEAILGAISFYTREEREFGAEEIEFLATLAGSCGIAIQKSQLYEVAAKSADDLAKANRIKDEFLSMVSHELRTPLNVVMGYTGLIKDGMLGEITELQEEALGKIQARSNDQMALVNNILHASTLETTGIKRNVLAVPMSNFFERLKESYQFPLGKDLTLEWHPPPSGLVVTTDPDKLKHVLQNLIDNAIKFTEEGSVTISARALPEEKALEIAVADTGIGIPKKHLPFIFDRFRQVDSSETRNYGGVGLGLYIVKKFTEMLHGVIEVESDPPHGSTFRVTIPFETPMEALANREPTSDRRQAGTVGQGSEMGK